MFLLHDNILHNACALYLCLGNNKTEEAEKEKPKLKSKQKLFYIFVQCFWMLWKPRWFSLCLFWPWTHWVILFTFTIALGRNTHCMSLHTSSDNAAIVCSAVERQCSASLSHPRLCCVTLDRCLGFRLRRASTTTRAKFTQQTGVKQGPVLRAVRPGDTDGLLPDVYLRTFGLELEVSQSWAPGACLTGSGLQLHTILSYQCTAGSITKQENLFFISNNQRNYKALVPRMPFCQSCAEQIFKEWLDRHVTLAAFIFMPSQLIVFLVLWK